MRQIYIGLAIHNHQPLGNFPWVFEQAYHQAYLPMIDALEKHPTIRLSMHYSGCLIDWLEQNRPEFLDRLTALVKRQQVEIIGGAYYEPILPSIPDADKLGQINKMAAFMEKRFGIKPRGMWLAERVWEPYLAKILSEASVEWTLVDDNAFKSLGLEENNLYGYYLTEEQGFSVRIFPISKRLRYSIPWHDVKDIIEYLDSEASETGDKIAILGDDGEKFGIWPGTYEYCWQKGWMDTFFKELEANNDWLNTILLGEYADKFPPKGRIYLPCASYEEMMEWSLPADKSWEYTNLKRRLEAEEHQNITQFMYSGMWRNFLVKYPEINRMHKKMLRVHKKVHQASTISKADCGMQELWKAQCNCPYWHGVFGGVYLTDIRATNYGYLVQAESKADNIIHRSRLRSGKVPRTNNTWLQWQNIDFDGDGVEELLIDSDSFSVYLSPAEGGSIFEWDLRSHGYNVLSTLARRPEAYHKVLTEPPHEKHTGEVSAIPSIHDVIKIKDNSSSSHLAYDRNLRSSLIDHFFVHGTKLEEFAAQTYDELGNFATEPYESSIQRRGDEVRILLKRIGILRNQSKNVPFEVRKQVKLVIGKGTLDVKYQLKNIGDSPVRGIFGSEWNLNLLGGGHNEQAYYRMDMIGLDDCHLDSCGELSGVEMIALGNRQLGIEMELKASPKIGLWRFPVESISNSEGGIERIYQESCLLAMIWLDLPPDEIAELNLVWKVGSPIVL